MLAAGKGSQLSLGALMRLPHSTQPRRSEKHTLALVGERTQHCVRMLEGRSGMSWKREGERDQNTSVKLLKELRQNDV